MIIFHPFKEHKAKLEIILKSISNNQNKLTLAKKNSNTLRNGEYKKNSLRLDLSFLKAPLYLDPKEEVLCVEPQITFKDLCQLTLSHGWVPLVVPEFKNITVGGAIMGAALESSSHLYGQFNDICLEYECLLGNGKILTCSPQEKSDLFYGISGSYGTLALLTLVKLKLRRAKKYVHLEHTAFSDPKKGISLIKNPGAYDFVDAVLFSPTKMVVSRGVMSDLPKKNHFRQTYWASPWYISHLLKIKENESSMPIQDYLFRFDRGAFWMGRYISNLKTLLQLFLKMGPKGNFPRFFSRFLFGGIYSSHSLYKLWHLVPTSYSKRLFFVHDYYLPLETFEEAFETFLKKTEIFPVWLCPVLGTQTAQFLSPHFGFKRFINIGLYGIPKKEKSIPELSHELEREVLSFKGRKMLYSFTYYDYETFSKAYDLNRYRELRKKYEAEKIFVDFYDKVNNSHL